MPIRNPGKAEGLFWLGIGVTMCGLAWRINLGSFHEPGPGFIGFVTGVFISSIGLVLFLSEVLSRVVPDESGVLNQAFQHVPWLRLFYTMTLLIIYALLLNTLGYIISTFLLMWGLFHDWEKNRWASSFLASLVTVGVTYVIFEVWLHCQFPRGIFPW
jgi:putative tricarboxylic transport membrane protein